MRRSGAFWALALVVFSAVALLVVWPLVELGSVAAEQPLAQAIAELLSGAALWNTVIIGSLVAVVTTTAGTGAALLTERSGLAARTWMRLAIVLPILIPPFVSAMSWLRAYGPGGLTDDLFGWDLPGLVGLPGIVLVISLNALPLAYLLAVAALRTRSDPESELASRVSGAGAASTFRHVTFPLMRNALGGIGALTFVIAINSFGVPAVLGTPAGVETMTTQIYQDFALSSRPEAFSRAILVASGLVVLALVVASLGEALSGQRAMRRDSRGGPAHAPRRQRKLIVALAAGFVAVLVLPTIALVLTALTRGVGLPASPGNWTTQNFRDAVDPRFLGALGRSVLLAATAATVALALGAATTAFRRLWLGRVAAVSAVLAFAIPGSALAIAILLAHGSRLRDTLLIILIAYVAKLWTVGHRAIDGSIDNVASDVRLAARISGATSSTAMRTVLMPLLTPAILAGWALVFLFAFHELTMSSLLYGPGTDTLAVAVLNLQQLGDVPVSSALAVILTLPLFVLALPLLRRQDSVVRLVDPG